MASVYADLHDRFSLCRRNDHLSIRHMDQHIMIGWQELVVMLLVVASLAYVVRNAWRRLTGRYCCAKPNKPDLIKIQLHAKKELSSRGDAEDAERACFFLSASPREH